MEYTATVITEQIPMFMAALKLFCNNCGWSDFYGDLRNLMVDNGILVCDERINSCFLSLDAKNHNKSGGHLVPSPNFKTKYQSDLSGSISQIPLKNKLSRKNWDENQSEG